MLGGGHISCHCGVVKGYPYSRFSYYRRDLPTITITIGNFTDSGFKNKISSQLNTKMILKQFMYLVIIYHSFKYLVGICLCSMLNCQLNLQLLPQNSLFSSPEPKAHR